MKKYLLSTGVCTSKIEDYILDLFRLNLQVWPGDIPGSNVGFDFIFSDTKKDMLQRDVKNRVESLVSRIQSQFGGIKIEVSGIDLIDETRVLITIDVRGTSDTILIDL